MATDWMQFSFFTCEVKCGNDSLNIAGRQNASVAVEGIFLTLQCQNEFHRKIFTFSISHDQEDVRI